MVNANPGSAMLDGAQAHALALAMYNAVAAQQQGAVVRQAATTMVCSAMLSLGIAETAEGATQPAAADADTAAAAPQAAQAAAAPLAETIPPINPLPPADPIDPAERRGKAYQCVTQATALAIQDAADYLRNVSTISSTALGVAMAQYLATSSDAGAAERYAAVIAATQQMMAAAVANFEAMGASAENLLTNFPEV